MNFEGGWLTKKKGWSANGSRLKKLPPQGPILFGYAVLSIYVIADDGIDNILIFPLLQLFFFLALKPTTKLF